MALEKGVISDSIIKNMLSLCSKAIKDEVGAGFIYVSASLIITSDSVHCTARVETRLLERTVAEL